MKTKTIISIVVIVLLILFIRWWLRKPSITFDDINWGNETISGEMSAYGERWGIYYLKGISGDNGLQQKGNVRFSIKTLGNIATFSIISDEKTVLQKTVDFSNKTIN